MSDTWPGQPEQAQAVWPGQPEGPKGIEVPEQIPEAMERRLIEGSEARKREGGLLQTIPQGIDMIATPEGRTKLWEAVKKYPSKFVDDMIDMAKVPGDVNSGKIDLSTDEGMDKAVGLGMLVGGSRLNKLSATGKTSGLAVTMGESVSRISKGPMGEIYDLPIGTAARSEDFVNAATIVAGEDAPMAVQQKMLDAYRERGIHPSELAHDAQTDPIIAQDLLSSKFIEAYHGTPHNFEVFDISKIGTGEGAQAYGHGLYFAENPNVARSYQLMGDATINGRPYDMNNPVHKAVSMVDEYGSRDAAIKEAKGRAAHDPGDFYGDVLTHLENGKALPQLDTSGNLYQVKIRADKEQMLDLDKRLNEQTPEVQEALKRAMGIDYHGNFDAAKSDRLWNQFQNAEGKTAVRQGFIASDDKLVAQRLSDAGIPGLKYLDEGSRGAVGGTRNFVMFDHADIQITHKNGAPVTAQEKADFLGGGSGGKPPKPPPEPPPEGSFEGAQKKILDKISVGDALPKEGWSWDKFYRKAVDDLHPLKAADGGPLGAYELARLTRGQFGKAEHFIEHGTFDFETYKTNGKPLAEILEPVSKDLDGLRAYLASKRALEIEASGRKSGMDVEAATRVAAEGEGKYGKAAGEIVNYQNKLLKYLKDSGVLSDAAFDAMAEAGKNYVPFYRVIGDTEGKGAGSSFGPANPVKRLKGSERDVIDPLESIVKNTYAYVNIAERNAVGIKLIDALKKDGAEVKVSKGTGKDPELVEYLKENGVTDPEKLVDFIKSAIPEDGDTLGAFRNGVKETVKVNDPELVTAFRGLDKTSADMLTRVLAVPATTLRAGATLSPDFIVRNVIRDFSTAFVNTGGAIFSPIDTAKGLIGVIRKDADFQNWLKGGGANSTMVALDRRYMQESLTKLTGETGLMERGWNVVTSPIRGLRMVSELAENATRLGEFKKLTGESKEAIQSAAFSSREVTLDFARIGASMRAYNMIIAFGNAQLQGLDRIGRAFADRPFNTTAKVAGGITLPSVLLWFANKDDERYKELPAWQKDLFWIVMTKDHIYRIPKPFELGVVFGSGAERILDATIGKNDEAFNDFAKSVTQVIMPNFIPTAVQPLVEQWANRSSFSDRTLIPKGMEDKLPEYQYTSYTTELTKKLGQVISAFPGMRSSAVGPGAPFGPIARTMTSPILMENYIRSWTGGLGMYAMQAADLGLRKAGVLPDPVTPTPTLADIPVVKAFMVRYPSATTQSIQDFYDQHEVTKKFYDTWLSKAKDGDVDAMERIQAAGGPMMFVRLDAIKETLTDHSKLVRDIYKNPTIKAEEKRQLIDSLYFNMIEIGKAGKGMLKDSEKALRTATDAAP